MTKAYVVTDGEYYFKGFEPKTEEEIRKHKAMEEYKQKFLDDVEKLKAEKEKKLREDIEQAFDVVSDDAEKAKSEKKALVDELVKLYKSLNLTPEEVRERNERNRAKFNNIMELITAQINERYNRWG